MNKNNCWTLMQRTSRRRILKKRKRHRTWYRLIFLNHLNQVQESPTRSSPSHVWHHGSPILRLFSKLNSRSVTPLFCSNLRVCSEVYTRYNSINGTGWSRDWIRLLLKIGIIQTAGYISWHLVVLRRTNAILTVGDIGGPVTFSWRALVATISYRDVQWMMELYSRLCVRQSKVVFLGYCLSRTRHY